MAYGTIKIGEMSIEMAANAASPYIFRQLFKEDFLKKLQEKEPDPDIFQKMGYVMAKQAETSKMSNLMKLTVDGFYDWLTQFEPLDILEATGEISTLYLSQTEGLSVPKEKGD